MKLDIKITDIKLYCLYLSAFFLPLSLKWNNIFIVLFIISYILEGGFNKKIANIKSSFIYIIPILLFFIINLLGLFNSYFINNAIRQIERSLPFLIIPIIFISQPKVFANSYKKILLSITIGCIFSMLIIWSSIFLEAFKNNEIDMLFSWKYSRVNFIKGVRTHPTYLSMFVLSSIAYIVSTNFKKKLQFIIITILTLFLFTLLSRIAIFLFMTSSLIYLVYNKKIIILLFMLIFSFSFFFLLVNSKADKSSFFKKILIEETGFSGSEKMDKRVYRWNYSWQMFLEKPVFGYGTGDADIIRVIKYKDNNEISAYKAKYNSHNQLLEYLSTQGIIGGLIFIFAFLNIFVKSIKINNYLLSYILISIFVIGLTESIFRRSLGVVYFSIISSIIIVLYINKKNEFKSV